ncbi:hypothetical protein QAD02_024130 [Eretmocerus hayati]|uniref:Uncharacterized protein n=1 Tax=Eretmocerus hayati TaxID=131215 RepID=A0ACC2Q2P2_9HYME|nr:hypothetical protein QAD02_024130 [Eretmocerus hayati]
MTYRAIPMSLEPMNLQSYRKRSAPSGLQTQALQKEIREMPIPTIDSSIQPRSRRCSHSSMQKQQNLEKAETLTTTTAVPGKTDSHSKYAAEGPVNSSQARISTIQVLPMHRAVGAHDPQRR